MIGESGAQSMTAKGMRVERRLVRLFATTDNSDDADGRPVGHARLVAQASLPVGWLTHQTGEDACPTGPLTPQARCLFHEPAIRPIRVIRGKKEKRGLPVPFEPVPFSFPK